MARMKAQSELLQNPLFMLATVIGIIVTAILLLLLFRRIFSAWS